MPKVSTAIIKGSAAPYRHVQDLETRDDILSVRVTVWIADNKDNSVLSENLSEAFRPRISLKTVQNCPSVRYPYSPSFPAQVDAHFSHFKSL